MSYNARKVILDSVLHIGKGIVRRTPDVGIPRNVLNFVLNPINIGIEAYQNYAENQSGSLSRGFNLD